MESSNQYQLKVSRQLINLLAVHGVSVNDALMFLTDNIERMLTVAPNFKKGRFRGGPKNNIQASDAWVMRGCYPNSNIFFKITVTTTKGNPVLDALSEPYFVSITAIEKKLNGNYHLLSSQLREQLFERTMEQNIFGAVSEIKPIVEHKTVAPRCLTPKGLKPMKRKRAKK